ncbi:MAG: VOC family protein [Muribaculaceae bacterium]|nr:VOC family protein [Muribaculaceae bacterium]
MGYKFHFDHYNFNVADLDRSIAFYANALGLAEVSRIVPDDGRFIIVYLGDSDTGFRLELTWLRDRTQPYDLGEGEFHLALRLGPKQDFDRVRQFHKDMGVVCYENPEMGIYFIEDPDGYWIEILPPAAN